MGRRNLWSGCTERLRRLPSRRRAGRKEAGYVLRLLQEGETPSMPRVEALPVVGPRCGALRLRDAGHNWRIMYRIDVDAFLILEVYVKKTRKIPQQIIERCRKRLNDYDNAVKKAAKDWTGK